MRGRNLEAEKAAEVPPLIENKPVVVGIYGIPGSGKSTLLNDLRQELAQDRLVFYEGSEVISLFVTDGLLAFQNLEEEEKKFHRKKAIDWIRQECMNSGKVGVVVGHFMFWKEEEHEGCAVHTQNDFNTFTHIIYLDTPSAVVAERCQKDGNRRRFSASASHLDKWQNAEKDGLQRLCRENRILFYHLIPSKSPDILVEEVSVLLEDFQRHNSDYNLSQAQKKLEEVLVNQDQIETVLMMDADKTLTAMDTSRLLWIKAPGDRGNLLKALFSGPLGYSYTAFRQAVLLYEELADDEQFEAICQGVAAEVTMHPEFVSLLRFVAEHKHTGAVVVTCGVKRIWEKVLERVGLSGSVSVVGGGRISDGFVVTASVKAALVSRLQDVHGMFVWAFGDSPLDIEMLCKADEAIVVSGMKNTRSKTMDVALSKAIDSGLRARQALLPSNAPPRLNSTVLPLVQLTRSADHGPFETASHPEAREPLNSSFIHSVLCRRRLQILQASERTAAALLMTPTRNAEVSGPGLKEAHRRIGWYLGTEFLGSVIGLEKITIEHVQGHTTSGHQLLHERSTSIIALMRGGEPMALGVNDAFPLAMFVHAKSPDDIKPEHLRDPGAVLLVDSVVNSGKTIVEFVQAIRNMHATIRIVVVAGVVQAESVSGERFEALGRYGSVSLIALRLSNNKFTGRGTTDTGNRLFNTTHIA
jgi:uracil phosphoribosyltransferase/phosphoserine phosphatase/adenylylsulfate kinase-like enzyme